MHMELISLTPPEMAALMLRAGTGILFLFQGYDKVFKVGVKGVVETVGPAYRSKGFPAGLVWLISLLTSWVELLCGALLLVGLFTLPAAAALGLNLLVVMAGLSILDPVQDLRLIFPRMLLLVMYLLFAAGVDIISVDRLLFQ